jgi:hypothetical protein
MPKTHLYGELLIIETTKGTYKIRDLKKKKVNTVTIPEIQG